jgi:hypothetical protein
VTRRNVRDALDLHEGEEAIDVRAGLDDQGLQMLEEWEKNSTLMLMGGTKEERLDINAPRKEAQLRPESGKSEYDNLFES